MKNRIDLCLSTDENFAELCTVAMLSVLKNANDSTECVFWVIQNNVKAKTLTLIEQSIIENGGEIHFVPAIKVSNLGIEIDTGRWSESCLQRLFICRLVPANVERVLYLDCDMVVRDDLYELFSTTLEPTYYAAAVVDCASTQNRYNIGLKKEDLYFNSGMFLISVKLWRDNNIEDEFIRVMLDKRIKYQYPDQDILNVILREKIKPVNAKYNALTHMYSYKHEELMYYHNADYYMSKDEYEEAKKNPTIIHYTQDSKQIRPWYVNSNHIWKKEWIFYRKLSPWKESDLWKDNRSLKTKIKMFLFQKLPSKVGLVGARYIYIKHTLDYKHVCKLEED